MNVLRRSIPVLRFACVALVTGMLVEAAQASASDALVQAEKNHREIAAAVAADQAALDLLHQEEARLRKQALAKSGSWIEPGDLWQKRTSLERKLASDIRREHRAKVLLSLARTQSRISGERHWSRAHKPSWFEGWWQW